MSNPSSVLLNGVLLMAPEDNCLIARVNIPAGQMIMIDGVAVIVSDNVSLGHKVARRNLRPGDKIIRYGAVIGTATAAIQAGAHVHTHNLASDYIPTYTLDASPQRSTCGAA